VDDAGFTLGTSSGVVIMGFAGTQSVGANDAAALACETDGALHIHDGGNTITVDGTVAANAGTNLNTSALLTTSAHDAAFGTAGSADAQVRTVQGVASMTALVVDGSAVTQPVSGTVTVTATNLDVQSGGADLATQATLATIDTDTGAISTSVALIDNPIVAHDAAASGSTGVMMSGGVVTDVDDTAPPQRVTAEADASRMAMDFDGTVFVRPHGPQVWSYHSDGSTALTDDAVHADPGAGLSLYVTDIVCSSGEATAMNVFFEEATTKILGPWYLEAIAGRGLSLHFQTPKKITVSTAFTVTTSQSIAHSVDVTGYVGQG